MFEKQHEPIAPLSTFVIRLLRSFFLGLLIIMIGLGMVGYRLFEPASSGLDAFYSAALILI